MCLQFDVYRNPSGRSSESHPYLMVIQHDYHEHLPSRLIVPLAYRNTFTDHHNPAAPLINIEFQRLFLNTPGITSVEKIRLTNKYYVCNLHSARNQVIAAIDALITNT